MKIEVIGSGSATKMLIDGVFQTDATITASETVKIPFGLVYVNNHRVYDAEFWVDGKLRFTIPPWGELVDLAYSALESKDWSRIDSIVTSSENPKMSLLRNAVRLTEIIESSQERKMLQLWESWMRVISVFRDNAQELAVVVDGIEKNDEPPDVKFEFLPQLDRALVNYVVSFKFVLDHLKWVKNRLPDRPEFGEIASRMGKLEKVEVVAFASILRNHLTHGSVVDPMQRMEFTKSGARLSLNLVPRVLLDEENHKKPYSSEAKRYIGNHLDQLSIKEFSSDLNKNTIEFCEKILEKVQTWHAPEVARLSKWRDELGEMDLNLASMNQHDSVINIKPLSYDLAFR